MLNCCADLKYCNFGILLHFDASTIHDVKHKDYKNIFKDILENQESLYNLNLKCNFVYLVVHLLLNPTEFSLIGLNYKSSEIMRFTIFT